MEGELTIQQVAVKTGLSVHTLRYYERIGLIAAIGRAPNGHRRYAESDIDWITFLVRMRATGMPIAQMQQYAGLRRQGAATITQRRELLEAHQRTVQQQLQELRNNLAVIEYKIEQYLQQETT